MGKIFLGLFLISTGTAIDSGADDCDGILPNALPPSHSIVTPHRDGDACGYVTVDGGGNVASLGSGSWTVVSRDGDILGAFAVQSDVMPQPSGFQGVSTSVRCSVEDLCFYHYHFNPDGTVRARSYLGAGDACGGTIGRIVGGGSEVRRFCASQLSLLRFDSDGNLVSSGIVRSGAFWVAVDTNGLSLVVYSDGAAFGYGPDDYVGRWFDEAVNPISDYFLILTTPGTRPVPTLRPLIGGGIVVQLGGDWVAMSPSGMPESRPAPDWLAPYSNYDIEIVRSGRAHALIPKYPVPDRSTVPLYSASGAHCGDATFPLPNVTVGMDGTAISSTGDDACTITWWPQVLP